MIGQYNLYHFENNFFDNPKNCGGLRIYQLGEMLCRPTTVVSPHQQPCYELTYVLSGRGKTITNGVECELYPGDCAINFPGDTHSIVSDPEAPLRYAFCGFMVNDEDPVCSGLVKELHRLFEGTSERILHMKEENNVFYEIFVEINSGNFMAAELITATLSRFLILLIRSKRQKSKSFYLPQIKNEAMLTYQIQRYLYHHACEIRKLTDLEQIFSYNYHYITKCFKKIAGETLGDYHTKCRMNTACKMLSEGISVTQISEALRYSSIHVFTRSFKNYFGMTPSEYRSRLKQSVAAVRDDPKGDTPHESQPV
ncbi:MAG: AraC family transcriptional regulator [Ruminococcaceae bacterium]|nr:AraC family transcriptional regulator [Oscillospiraceae bacterium]